MPYSPCRRFCRQPIHFFLSKYRFVHIKMTVIKKISVMTKLYIYCIITISIYILASINR